MSRPRLLDLFCCAGGASKGYHDAGFEVIGVDLSPQPNYPFAFVQADAIAYAYRWGHLFDVIAASPPCQGYSRMSNCRPGLADSYPRLVEPVREMLTDLGKPYVIENVPGAPLKDPITLCGAMFGKPIYRHRLFESNIPITAPTHPAHTVRASKAGHWKPGTYISVSGNCAPVAMARAAMEIDWTTREELGEAIPPYFTRHIGRQLMASLLVGAS